MNEDIRILVVDDNKENLRVVSNYLKEKGYQIALALDGRSAMAILENDYFDLILLDIMMPGIDGFEVCKRIKENKELKDIPIIFLTAKNDTEDIVKGFESGGADYITKPFNKEELFARVSNHIELKLYRDLLKNQLRESKDSRNKMMKTLLDFGKMVDPRYRIN